MSAQDSGMGSGEGQKGILELCYLSCMMLPSVAKASDRAKGSEGMACELRGSGPCDFNRRAFRYAWFACSSWPFKCSVRPRCAYVSTDLGLKIMAFLENKRQVHFARLNDK